MMVPLPRFNIILVLLLLAAAGCKTSDEKKTAKQKKEATFLRFHVEANPDGTHHVVPAVVYRANPVVLHVQRDAELDEGFMDKAEVVPADEFGGLAIKIQFDETGTRRLDYITSSFKGRRLAINCRWTETRFLAAPLITKRITDGAFVFTPDASREEAERIVAGLNNVITKLKKPYTF